MFSIRRQLTAGLIVVVSAAAPAPVGAQAASPPPPTQLKPMQVKWILPPAGSAFYASEKANAEAMGYDTVENGDLSYPARP